ncbi:MAG: hypothetical protein K2K15_02910, partial [Anaeroplasmataceae bacterium]|nr:hypothetical protein [Anaeroplasmataceae bacterium]
EGILFGEENKTVLKEITQEEYIYLTSDSEQVSNLSKQGQILMENQSVFETYHKYESFDSGIQTYSIQRNNRSAYQMTSTDAYLKAYYSIYEGGQNFSRRYCDNIINLIPEDYFYQEGIHTYVGNEYAFLIETLPGYSNYQFKNCYICNVCIYDINTSLPYLSQMHHGTGDISGVQMSTEIEISIKPYLIRTYYAYDRQYCNEDSWLKTFDTSEQRVIVARYDAYKHFYIAPNTFGLGLSEDSDCTCSNETKISHFEYNFKVNEATYPVNTSLTAKNLFLSMSSAILSSFPKGRMVDVVKKVVVEFLDTYNHQNAKPDRCELINEVNELTFKTNYSARKELMPTSIYLEHPSYFDVFGYGALSDYEHLYTINLSLFDPLPNHYYDLKSYCFFDFYNNDGGLVSENVGREYGIKNLNLDVNAAQNEEYPIPYSLIETNFLYSSIDVPGRSQTILFKAPSDGVYDINFYPTNSFVVAKIYDINGYLLQTNEDNEDFVNDLLLELKEGEVYFLYLKLLSEKDTANINIKFTKWSGENPIPLGELAVSYDMPHGYIYDTFYFRFCLTIGGVYTFYTESSEDTTIRIYCSETYGILVESFDPLADWSDEYPNQNAYCEFRSGGPNRLVTVGVYVRTRCNFKFHVRYRSAL